MSISVLCIVQSQLVGASGSGVRGVAWAGTSTAKNPVVLAHAATANNVTTALVDMAHLHGVSISTVAAR